MKQASNKKAIYDHNFRESKQSVIKWKPVKMMTKPPMILSMRPSTIPAKASLSSIIHDMPNPVKQRRRPIKSGNWFDQSPDILSFTAPQYQHIQNIYPFSPEIPLFPFHIPYPVSAPFMPESLFQSINHQSLILPTSTVSTAVTTTRSTATLPLPVFPTLAMHPEFQNLTVTPKKLKQKMVNSNRRYNCDEDFDDDDDNSRSNFRMKFD
ncbi:Uncharacterized protein BM_BM11080 [Brugia malayi]|uniref:Bm11080 n=2 Tax=Brugia TaxID=6278 RepID=A0A0J9Y2X4_BRUMA|nr:Uncharacterized protein BM_BM11080 [Brugia malayi]CDQ01189.1 Bm11080 [Brugia malayi]VDO20975.1 unnamed protein product [Brugia timori]VIO94673.1 Uncharacterized protein BM_BM11080 [Brugia malayi]